MKKTVIFGFMLALALILSYIESLVPLTVGIPGIKLGLPNLLIVIILYLYGGREAILLNLLRIVLGGFLFGSLFSIAYAASGAVVSFFVMYLLKRTEHFSITGVSISGGVFHNIGQMIVAVLVVETYGPVVYLPILLVAGLVTGGVIGLISSRVLPYARRIIERYGT